MRGDRASGADTVEQIPDQGVLLTYTFNWDPRRVPMLAFGTREQFDDLVLPTWVVLPGGLEATSMRFPAIITKVAEKASPTSRGRSSGRAPR